MIYSTTTGYPNVLFFKKYNSFCIQCREIRGAQLEYHIHFWLGNATAADKSGVAAYKTVELDGYLGGTATQHRETQGNESARFKSYFKNGFR